MVKRKLTEKDKLNCLNNLNYSIKGTILKFYEDNDLFGMTRELFKFIDRKEKSYKNIYDLIKEVDSLIEKKNNIICLCENVKIHRNSTYGEIEEAIDYILQKKIECCKVKIEGIFKS